MAGFKIENQNEPNLRNKWFMLAVLALGLSGVYSLIIALLRVPAFAKLMPYENFFRIALVVHVDLSVLLWFLIFIMAFAAANLAKNLLFIEKSLFYLVLASIIMLASSPFAGGVPYINNYVLILENILFILGLALFMGCFTALIFLNLLAAKQSKQNLFINLSLFIYIVAIVAFIDSYRYLSINGNLLIDNKENYYEVLFWGFGHVIQFIYVLILLYCWAALSELQQSLGFKIALIAHAICLLPVLLIIFFIDINDSDYANYFTQHMKYFGGVSSALMIFLLIGKKKLNHYLLASLLLYIVGGLLGFKISESNTTIPSHYHGCIVGVSVAMMGVIIKNFDSSKLDSKLLKWQNFLYSSGQLMHLFGLAASGGYGALRKTITGEYSQEAKIYLGFIGAGGLIAIIGGLMFFIIATKILYNRTQQQKITN